MKLREDKWLEEQVAGWVAEKLITDRQGKSILERRRKDSRGSALNASLLLAALGGLCVALGIALVISYNWEKIPRFVKVPCFLLLLALAAESYNRVPAVQKIPRTALLLLWFIMPLAGIGLWAQIYQLSGDPLKPLLIWLLMGLPLVLKSGNAPLAFFHTAGLVWAAYVGAFENNTWLSLTRSGVWWRYGENEISLSQFLVDFGPACLGLILLWAYTLRQGRRLLGDRSKWFLLISFLLFLWSLFWNNTPFYSYGSLSYTVAGALLALYWGLKDFLRFERHPWEGWGLFFAFLCLYALGFLWNEHSRDSASPLGGYLAILLLLAGTFLVGFLKVEGMVSTPAMMRVLKFLVLAPGLLGLSLLAGVPDKVVAIAANLAYLGFALWYVREGVENKEPLKINRGMVLIGLLILTRFLDYFGTMLQSGIAFIVMGLFFVGVSWALNQGRKKLLAEVGRRG